MTGTPTALHATFSPNPLPKADTPIKTDLDRILRKNELCELLGVTTSTLYRWTRTEGLPKPIKLGANSIGWKLSEVRAWLDSRQRGLTTEGVCNAVNKN